MVWKPRLVQLQSGSESHAIIPWIRNRISIHVFWEAPPGRIAGAVRFKFFTSAPAPRVSVNCQVLRTSRLYSLPQTLRFIFSSYQAPLVGQVGLVANVPENVRRFGISVYVARSHDKSEVSSSFRGNVLVA